VISLYSLSEYFSVELKRTHILNERQIKVEFEIKAEEPTQAFLLFKVENLDLSYKKTFNEFFLKQEVRVEE